jgi:hypothetical protein
MHGPEKWKPVFGQGHASEKGGCGGRVENRKSLQYNSKSAARRGGTFLFGARTQSEKQMSG